MMDPSVPGLRDWYRGYLKALLDEYAKDVDGFVWDETFYIPTNFISYRRGRTGLCGSRHDELGGGTDPDGAILS